LSEVEVKKLEEADFKVYNINDLFEHGKENKVKLNKPSAEDWFTICYTSGTTGDPKGVISTHQNYAATLGGLYKVGVDIKESDTHYSYLPLAHVFERGAHWAIIAVGGKIGYYQGDVTKIKDDCSELKPTIFCSVPRLLNRFYDLMQDGITKVTGFKKTLIDRGVRIKLDNLNKNGSVKDTLYDTLVFKKFRQTLGGRVRIMITGSAPIEKDVLSFLKIAFSCKVFEAYGQTETTGGLTCTNPKDGSAGHVGGVFSHNELKLVDVPEMDYTSKDMIDGVNQPRGEIVCRGHNCFIGYFKLPEKTKEVLDSDGWLYTGDVGQILPNGSLRIIDRKKNIFKLAQGEYIAAEKLEGAYGKLDVVKQVFIYGDSLQAILVAIFVPEMANVLRWAEENGHGSKDMDDSTYNEFINGDVFKNHLESLIKQTRKNENLTGLEVPKKWFCTADEFTVENDLLTPTFKLKRNEAKKKYYQQIKDMYDGAKLQGE
jgi:long-chain acyl-CoA synthetase